MLCLCTTYFSDNVWCALLTLRHVFPIGSFSHHRKQASILSSLYCSKMLPKNSLKGNTINNNLPGIPTMAWKGIGGIAGGMPGGWWLPIFGGAVNIGGIWPGGAGIPDIGGGWNPGWGGKNPGPGGIPGGIPCGTPDEFGLSDKKNCIQWGLQIFLFNTKRHMWKLLSFAKFNNYEITMNIPNLVLPIKGIEGRIQVWFSL